MSSAVVATEGLSCSYRIGRVLEDISFTVAAGDYVGIVGPNGSGKSTLVRALMGFCAVSEGKASLFGMPCGRFTQWGRIGYLPQTLGVFNPVFPATVAETVSLGLLSLKRFPRRLSRADREKVADTLEELGVHDLHDKLIGELSGGQQQRVMLARALVNAPELLILDEPTAALDPETRERFYRIIGDLNRNKGVTVLLVTHDTGTIGGHASKMLYLDKRLLFYGGFDEFCQSPAMSDLFGEHSQHLMCHRH
ncbi:metal ABC transporter ATP-binding protein [Geobacter sp. SVR]|uniref:metal ABC transporter ATP-binding protein n=1 Tax=Geobacter sp. SVR TaxID=2495594 RepID=UPI00143EF8DA|nr:metal ABC transporter ATP-binding protein [Geobacter sp. SVR]BCS53747.1 ABC transporter ATP-binding protein [Geobacter sp. SVR]GCF85744.1 ABC transporter ATP-binding protein [Geobacter sp. SVR]